MFNTWASTFQKGFQKYRIRYSASQYIAINWFRQYFLDYEQYIFIASGESCILKIPCGVPLGSGHGPIIFTIILVNDLCSVLLMTAFADIQCSI